MMEYYSRMIALWPLSNCKVAKFYISCQLQKNYYQALWKKLSGELVKLEAEVLFTIQDVKAMIQSLSGIFPA